MEFRDAEGDKVKSDGAGAYCAKQDKVQAYIDKYDGRLQFVSGKRTVWFDFSEFIDPPVGTDFAVWFEVVKNLGATEDVRITARIGDWQIRWNQLDPASFQAMDDDNDGSIDRWVVEVTAEDMAEMKLYVERKGKGRPGAYWEDHGRASLPMQFTFRPN